MTIYYLLITGALSFFLWRSYKVRSVSTAAHEGEADSISIRDLFVTLLATAMGGGLIFGLIQFGQTAGTIGLLLGFVYCGSFIALGFLAPTIRKACASLRETDAIEEHETISVVALLSRRYNRITWSLILLAYQIVYIGFLAAQFVALARLSQALGVPLSETMLIICVAAVVLVYVSLGGFKAVVATEFAQFGIITLILVLSVIAICQEGAVNFSKLSSDYWDPFAKAELASTFVWLAIFLLPTLLLRLDHWQRIVAAQDDRTAKISYVAAGFTLLVVFVVLLLVGASATSSGSSSPFFLYTKHFRASGGFGGEFLFASVFTALLCAVVSSADTILNAGAASVVQSLRAWHIVRGKGIVPIVLVSIGITLFAVIAATFKPDIIGLITEGFKVMVILLPAIAAALVKRSPSDTAGSLSVAGGLITWALLYFTTPIGMWGYIFGFIVALLLLILIYRIERELKYRL